MCEERIVLVFYALRILRTFILSCKFCCPVVCSNLISCINAYISATNAFRFTASAWMLLCISCDCSRRRWSDRHPCAARCSARAERSGCAGEASANISWLGSSSCSCISSVSKSAAAAAAVDMKFYKRRAVSLNVCCNVAWPSLGYTATTTRLCKLFVANGAAT